MISRVFVMAIGLAKTIITTDTFPNSEDSGSSWPHTVPLYYIGDVRGWPKRQANS